MDTYCGCVENRCVTRSQKSGRRVSLALCLRINAKLFGEMGLVYAKKTNRRADISDSERIGERTRRLRGPHDYISRNLLIDPMYICVKIRKTMVTIIAATSTQTKKPAIFADIDRASRALS
jgi:hypothetical protein